MNPSLLAFCVWPAAFLAAGAGLILSDRSAEVASGEIVEENIAYCDFFILKTERGFVYVKDLSREVISLAGSNRVSGRLFTAGLQQVRLDDRETIEVRILGSTTDRVAARGRFADECRAADLDHEFLSRPDFLVASPAVHRTSAACDR